MPAACWWKQMLQTKLLQASMRNLVATEARFWGFRTVLGIALLI